MLAVEHVHQSRWNLAAVLCLEGYGFVMMDSLVNKTDVFIDGTGVDYFSIATCTIGDASLSVKGTLSRLTCMTSTH